MLEKLPLYIQAQEYILQSIDDGTYRPGDQLPSEADLAGQLGISRPTLREALFQLEKDGVVNRRHGIGTFVATGYKRRLKSGLEQLESILEMAGRQHLSVQYDTLQVVEEPADPKIADRLQIISDTPLTVVRRVIVLDKKPVAYMQDCTFTSMLSPGDVDQYFNGSVLDLLRQKKGLQVSHAVADIIALSANGSLAEKLSVDVGSALLLLEEVLYDEESEPVEYSCNYFIPEYFRFRVVRR